jgi:methylamine methyltransferase corrinoid activation protein
MSQGISLDIGTSGLRAQLLNIENKKVLRTVIVSHNPLPGANVMDHLNFAIDYGQDVAHSLLIRATEMLIANLEPEGLERMAVCGNPIQLSLFEGIETRDLAFAGKGALLRNKIVAPDRSGHVVDGGKIGLKEDIDVVIPPSIRHEVGADALAMMIMTGFLEDDRCLVTDFGTNAEMAIKVGDDIFTGSASAGPAIEGQHISNGMLASPGAISDLCPDGGGWRAMVLNDKLEAEPGSLVRIRAGTYKAQNLKAVGITGTGVIATIYAGMVADRIQIPHILSGPISLDRDVCFTESDLTEAGKALGAIRAGHFTLMKEAGLDPKDLNVMYMSGASGVYVDPLKARAVGMIPSAAKKIVQMGNTSIELANRIVLDPEYIDELKSIRQQLLSHHIMFASSTTFSDLFLQELAYWIEGMPWEKYCQNMKYLGLDAKIGTSISPTVIKGHDRDIYDIGSSLTTIESDVTLQGRWDCSNCMTCVNSCPEDALSLVGNDFFVNSGKCLGTACRKCEEVCPENIFHYGNLVLQITK